MQSLQLRPSGLKLSADMSPKTPAEKERMASVPYRQGVDKLIYAANTTRLEVAYATSALSQFLENLGLEHWICVKRVFGYLKGTPHRGIRYCYTPGQPLELEVYTNSDYVGNVDSQKSVSGYVVSIAGGPICWMSKKQPTVALSSTEAEYRVLTSAAKEIIWCKLLFSEMGISLPTCIVIKTDNQGSMALAQNPVFHARTKHVEVEYDFIRDLIKSGKISLEYVATQDNPVDILTRALGRELHEKHVRRLGLGDSSEFLGPMPEI